jgi:hypothetical protein
MEREELTFSRFAGQLAIGLSDPPASAASEPDQALLVEEVEIGCTLGMLLCLDRDLRIAYVLGDVFELSSDEAATVLEIPSATYRKRLSRAREKLRTFMRGHCGLVNPDRPCRCERRVTHAIATGIVQPTALVFARSARTHSKRPNVAQERKEMTDLHRIAALYQSHPAYATPDRVLTGIRQILDGGQFSVL